MQENIYRKPRLAIISDTGMYLKGGIFIFEPVFREVQNLSHLFSEIYWLGYALKKYSPPHYKQNYIDNNELFIINEGDDSALIKRLKKYSKNKLPKHLKLFTIKLGGGNTYTAKMSVIFYLPYYLKNIFNLIRRADVIFTRGPSIPALLTVFISFLYPNKIFLHKYAGSWQLQSHTFSYRFQKWILQKNIPGIVTVNLRNNTDPHHIHSLFNPCLTVNELENNNKVGIKKQFNEKLTFCFVGRLEKDKGFPLLLDTIGKLGAIDWINKLHCVGEGSDRIEYESKTRNYKIPVIFHGLLDREYLNKIYKESHFIILPSQSEGFPKVLAEASSFGCIPIAASIPSIKEHINADNYNGILITDYSIDAISKSINYIKNLRPELSIISKNAIKNSKKFTYEKYSQVIEQMLKDSEL